MEKHNWNRNSNEDGQLPHKSGLSEEEFNKDFVTRFLPQITRKLSGSDGAVVLTLDKVDDNDLHPYRIRSFMALPVSVTLAEDVAEKMFKTIISMRSKGVQNALTSMELDDSASPCTCPEFQMGGEASKIHLLNKSAKLWELTDRGFQSEMKRAMLKLYKKHMDAKKAIQELQDQFDKLENDPSIDPIEKETLRNALDTVKKLSKFFESAVMLDDIFGGDEGAKEA